MISDGNHGLIEAPKVSDAATVRAALTNRFANPNALSLHGKASINLASFANSLATRCWAGAPS